MASAPAESMSQSDLESGARIPSGPQIAGEFSLKVDDDVRQISSEHLYKWYQALEEIIPPASQSHVAASPQQPITIPNCTTDEFEVVQLVIEGSRWQNLSTSQWATVLKFATQAKSDKLRKVAIAQLEDALQDPTEKLALGVEHKVAAWIISSASILSQAGVTLDLSGMGSRLGWKTTARVAEAARFTSELSKCKPIVVRTTTLECSQPRCDNSLSYSLAPRMVDEDKMKAREAPSTIVVGWRPREKVQNRDLFHYPGEFAKWNCGQCPTTEGGSSYTHRHPGANRNPEIPLEIVLNDLIPNYQVDNTEIVRRIFAEELKDAY